MANSQNLEDMKLPELKELAKQMGLRGTSTMRKPELLATLQAARSGSEPPAGVTVRTSKATAKREQSAKAAPAEDLVAVAEAASVPVEPVEDKQAKAEPDVNSDDRESEKPAKGVARKRIRKPRAAAETVMPKGDDLLASLDLGDKPVDEDRDGERVEIERRKRHRDSRRAESKQGETLIRRVRDDEDQPRRRRQQIDSEESVRDLDDILATLPSQKQDEETVEDGADREFARHSRNRRAERADHAIADRRGRRLRGRDSARETDEREIDRRAERDSRREEPTDDLVPVAGIVDVLDSYAFVRTSGYLPGPNDVYVSMGQVKKYGLRKGDAVHGSIRTPRENDRRNQRQKFVPLQSIDSINGMSVEEAMNRPQFSKLTPLYPQERLKQETVPNKLTGRIMDIVSPIGKGQRGLIVSPPKAGKTITLQNIANSIAANNPEVHLMVVLVDERPEEVTDMERTVQGEVISSTFDRPASDHTTVAELAIERAKRLVELGQDVVVLLDSMTRLARAYNIAAPASGRILSGGVDAQALYPPKKFFGAARNIENGGSLTIISSALVETGSKMDEVIFEEFKGTGNMELRLSRELADKRLFPAIDINASGTRREELITNPQELPIIYRLRRLLGGMEPEQAYQTLVPRLKKTATNRDFLAAIVQQSNSSAVNGN